MVFGVFYLNICVPIRHLLQLLRNVKDNIDMYSFSNNFLQQLKKKITAVLIFSPISYILKEFCSSEIEYSQFLWQLLTGHSLQFKTRTHESRITLILKRYNPMKKQLPKWNLQHCSISMLHNPALCQGKFHMEITNEANSSITMKCTLEVDHSFLSLQTTKAPEETQRADQVLTTQHIAGNKNQITFLHL